MKTILVNIILLTCFISKAQVGVVTDPDGYLNVRNAPQGKIIDRLADGEIFFINVDMDDAIWKEITYGNDGRTGYVYYSNITELKKFKTPKESIPQLCFKTDKVSNTKNRQFVGGMNLPLQESFELIGIDLIIDGSVTKQKDEYVFDVLTPFLPTRIYSSNELVAENKMQVYENDEFTYYRMKIGDGSEYYESIWVVKNGEIIQRLMGWIT